jgi:hypothetical protein
MSNSKGIKYEDLPEPKYIRPAPNEINAHLSKEEYGAACDRFNWMRPKAIQQFIDNLDVVALEADEECVAKEQQDRLEAANGRKEADNL